MRPNLLLLGLFFIIEKVCPYSFQPTQNQDADAAWLSHKIYEGAHALNSNYGCVIKTDNWRYAIWKHYRTKECYVVIRGTNVFDSSDILADLNVKEYFDNEISVGVHNGVRLRTEYIMDDIGDKLKECKRDIIITGHSLGGAVSHYLFLKYVYKHFFSWRQYLKAFRFKAVIFGAPQLVTRSNNQFLIQSENRINWYKYENDPIPELIRNIKKSRSYRLFMFFNKIMKRNLIISSLAYDLLKGVHYGYYIPGHYYHLLHYGEKKPYRYDPSKNWNIIDHIFMDATYNAIIKNGWGTESPEYKDDTVNCLNINFINFLTAEEKVTKEETPKIVNEDEEISIDTAECEDVKNYDLEAQVEDSAIYIRNDNSSYMIKRILDNHKEYEYDMCIDNKLTIKQCDAKCNCHEVTKNDRPKEITQCSSNQLDGVMFCLVDGVNKEIEIKDYYSFASQTKIGDYYLMDYFCNNQTFSRGNYKSSQSFTKSSLLILLLLFLLI